MKANKKILCVILALIMCMSSSIIAVSSIGYPDNFNPEYKEIVFDALDWDLNPDDYVYSCEYAYNADGTTPDKGETPDFILAFANHDGVVHDMVIDTEIGGYRFTSGCSFFPYDMGYFIYSFKEHKCYSLEEAWEAKLPNMEAVLKMLGTRVDTSASEKYMDKVFDILGWEVGALDPYTGSPMYEYSLCLEFNADGTEATDDATADYALIFAHTGPMLCWEVYETIGNYRLNSAAVHNPGYIIYSTGEDRIYKIREAYNQGLPGMNLVLEKLGTKVTLYADVFEKFLEPYKDPYEENSVFGWYGYSEDYYYSKELGGTAEMPQATPDYVLVDACAYHCPPANVTEVFGDYVVYSGWGNPERLRYFIYIPESGTIYTLREAYDMNLEGIMNVFTDYSLGFLSGDMDNNGKLSIKDATYIQKCLAKIEGYSIYGVDTSIADFGVHISVADFNRDLDENIKDVTALQKKLANIE